LLARLDVLEKAEPVDLSKYPTKEELTVFNTQLAEVGKVIETLSEISVEVPTTLPKEEAKKDQAANFSAVANAFFTPQPE